MSDAPLLSSLGVLAASFATLSLLAIGGANAVVPEMHRQAVEVNHWMTGSEFAELFALAQATPGPNVLIVALIGWKVAGVAGAFVSTAAMCGPSCLLTFVVTRIWHRARRTRLRASVEAGLGPLTVGLILASGYLLSRSADANWVAALVTMVSAACLLATKVHPLAVLAVGAVVGALGWIPG